jgi:hypothetical protein
LLTIAKALIHMKLDGITIPRLWLLLTVPVLLIGLWLLVRAIISLVRTVRQSSVLTVPLAPSQPIRFREAGPLDLYLEGKRGANLSGLDFQLRDETGRLVPLDSLVLRTTVSGVSRVRIKVGSLILPYEGTFILEIAGLRPGMDPENRVVVGRPIGGLIAAHVAGFVALGLLIVGSLLASVLAILPRR